MNQMKPVLRAHTFALNWQLLLLNDIAEGSDLTVEIILRSISNKVLDQAAIKLGTPGSSVRHASVARHVTDCLRGPIWRFVPAATFVPAIILVPAANFVLAGIFVSAAYFVLAAIFCPSRNFCASSKFCASRNFVPAANFVLAGIFVPAANFVLAEFFVPATNFVLAKFFY